MTIDQAQYLADVGYGNGTADGPLLLSSRESQKDAAGNFQFSDETITARHPTKDEMITLDVVTLARDQTKQFSLHPASIALEDFAHACHVVQSEPRSPFIKGTICTLPTKFGRKTIAGNRYIVAIGEDRYESTFKDAAELGTVLKKEFGISLGEDDIQVLFDAGASRLVEGSMQENRSATRNADPRIVGESLDRFEPTL